MSELDDLEKYWKEIKAQPKKKAEVPLYRGSPVVITTPPSGMIVARSSGTDSNPMYTWDWYGTI